MIMEKTKILLIGSGAREHAIALAAKQSGAELISLIDKKNPGIMELSEKFIFKPLDANFDWLEKIEADLAIIGPEKPLSMGYADVLEEKGIPSIGPFKKPAMIETSKIFARTLMETHKIPGYPTFFVCKNEEEVKQAFKELNNQVAIKPDGLTGGKGVKISDEHFSNIDEAIKYALKLIEKDGAVLIEEKIKGIEFTAQAFTDGKSISIMPLVKDYKRAYENDKGPNTGSMGAISLPDHQLPYISQETMHQVQNIMKKAIDSVRKETGLPYKGILYGQFMQTEKGPVVIEFNARFGDPEAMNVLSLLKTPLTEVSYQIIHQSLQKPEFERKATFCLYVVPEGYPEKPISNYPVKLDFNDEDLGNDSTIYFGSVNKQEGQILTTTSRTLAILTKNENLSKARNKAYQLARKISGKIRYRNDIGKEFV